jgi:cold shock CspA family protein
MSETTGTIVFYSPAKQFGFIRPDGAEVGKDVFFHIEQYDHDGDPAIDTRVAFMIEADPRRERPAASKGGCSYPKFAGGFGAGTRLAGRLANLLVVH